jgi:glucose-6-phosphate 1-epimerase
MPIKDELEYIEIENSVASVKIALQGAQLFDYTIKGKGSVLFLSETADFKKGKAIRGGIPVCWPWFGENKHDYSLPKHGFARTSLWRHVTTEMLNESKTKVTLELQSSPQTFELWPYDFRLTLDIYISEQLRVELSTVNRDTKSFDISSALHTYLKIEDINSIEVNGLQDRRYFDKTINSWNIEESPIDFTKEVDRIYQNVDNDVIVKDATVRHTLESEGTKTIVVWNPAKVLAENMSDLSHHTQMLCVESANVLDDTVTLNPGEFHTLVQVIKTDFSIFQ